VTDGTTAQVIVEGTLELEFGDEWDLVLKWDECRSYREGIHRLGDCKAVDVLALSRARRQLLMIELKDFRGHRIENKDRIKGSDLFVEVGHKARDTVAGICGAARTGGDADVARIAVDLVSTTPLTVVLWIEEDRHAQDAPVARRKRHKTRLDVMRRELKERLRWLTARVMICSCEASDLREHGIVVRRLPRGDLV
jgi:hypothetical protein